MTSLLKFVHDETGATAIEYALIAAATGLALVATLPLISTNLSSLYSSLAAGFN